MQKFSATKTKKAKIFSLENIFEEKLSSKNCRLQERRQTVYLSEMDEENHNRENWI